MEPSRAAPSMRRSAISWSSMFDQVGSAYLVKLDPTGRFLLCNIPRKWTDVPESRIGEPGRRLDRGELPVCGDKGARCGGARCGWIPLCQGGDMAVCCASGSTQGRGTPHRSGSVKKAGVTGQSAEFHSSFLNRDEIRRLRPFRQLPEKLSDCSTTPNRKPCAGRRHGRCAPT